MQKAVIVHNKSMSSASTTFTDIWNSRPHRVLGTPIAGVCEGIAVRYQVDVTIVRVAFAILTLAGGGGIALYLLAWGLMPKGSNTFGPLDAAFVNKGAGHPEFSQQRNTGIGLFIVLLLMLFGGSSASDGLAGGGFLLGVVVGAAAIYALHMRTPVPPIPQGPDHVHGTPDTADSPQGAPESAQSAQFVQPEGPAQAGDEDAAEEDAENFAHDAQRTPPSWDPLGAAPFAWDLPDPQEEEQPKKSNWVRNLFLAVVGVIVTLGIMFTAVVAYFEDDNTYDDVSTTSDLQDTYQMSVGDFELDLRGLHTLERDRTITIRGGIGDIEIIAPRTIPTQVVRHGGIGDFRGPSTLNDDASGPRLTINIKAGVGDIRVTIANEASTD